MSKRKYDHKTIEPKWREDWSKKSLYTPDIKNAPKPFYNLMMFPYPSAEGLHVGNMYAFSGTDVYGRYQRMNGYSVFEPIGLDGFGIHSENYAIKVGRHPREQAELSQKNFYHQLSQIGNSYAWDYRLETYDPAYYRWTQWLFTELFKAGLAYRGSAMVNWCPSCKTVLADEQVEDGECERCGSVVDRRKMSSWYFRITDYADKLLENIDGTQAVSSQQSAVSTTNASNDGKDQESENWDDDVKRYGLRWPETIKTAQRKWIGKKAGINITYEIKDTDNTVTCFTTRPDTNFGATFIVVSPEYAQNIFSIIPEKFQNEAGKYIKESLNKSEQQRLEEGKKKTGAFTGLYAVNNLNDYEMPIYIADFVLSGVGTGAVVGVPGHDVRDFEFAKTFDLPVKRVVKTSDDDTSKIESVDQVQEAEGTMINSEFLDGLDIHDATQKIMDHLEENGWGERVFNYHLRDWLISRQRYWGPPIPMIHCAKCAEDGKSWFTQNKGKRIHEDVNWDHAGWYPEEKFPVELPDIQDFKPKGDGTSPLSNAPKEWRETKCPVCGGVAERELDVSDTFLDSSWYFLAYPNLKTKEWQEGDKPFNDEIIKKWLPVSAYIGGAEHAVLHLLYARFVTMVLNDLGYIDFEEPFPFLFGHGLIIKDGAKMSKSKGNVINPDDYIAKFGADALRCYLMFLGPYSAGGDFRDTGMEGMHRFLTRVWSLITEDDNVLLTEKENKELEQKLHQTIKKVTMDMEQFKYNTSLSSIMELVNHMRDFAHGDVKGARNAKSDSSVWDTSQKVLVQLLAPFAPHMTEELWQEHFGEEESVHVSLWPKYSEESTKESVVTVAIQVNGKLRGTLEVDSEEAKNKEALLGHIESDDTIYKWIEGKNVIKEIFVPGKLMNFVVKE